MGPRIKRTKRFWIHLAVAIPFLFSLFTLSFIAQPAWLIFFVVLSSLFVLVSGLVLLACRSTNNK